ncbi:pilus assembly PilX family protein [Alysiella filiformis]|uniref:Type IV pilus assembly protein PilX n=1 Tax=Alysiella filiformis DSM 16848 TaxID=1120981 RepID=A0A286EFR1_9NEIS|nr:PilX N-terminal domain-containing pilus assembly protein [Alysiella filiformis]QMT30486.1 hypothetical protein H3L97_06910 [Alysiella filiformis]UBQ56531.1 hypothetical protein JF568_01770 [Alysiella filiformis DSM 16848]SOD69762.1 type IV pilus assembly protein PilX [Alysiella filiformis DSM 16848]
MMNNKYNQQGFSLFMVMIMMIVIAFLVVITSQTTSTESRLSANEADRKYALTEAEVGLRDGETYLNKVYNDISKGASSTSYVGANLVFTQDCQKGLCAPVEKIVWSNDNDKKHFNISDADNGKSSKPAWERDNIFDPTKNFSIASENNKARYIIEYMGQREDPSSSAIHDYFRVTSRANGENKNTVVTLQSYVEMTRSP